MAAVQEAVPASAVVQEADSVAREVTEEVPECHHHLQEGHITDIGMEVRECPRHHTEVRDTDLVTEVPAVVIDIVTEVSAVVSYQQFWRSLSF